MKFGLNFRLQSHFESLSLRNGASYLKFKKTSRVSSVVCLMSSPNLEQLGSLNSKNELLIGVPEVEARNGLSVYCVHL